MRIPLLADLTKQISKDYGVLLESEGNTLRFVSYLHSLTDSSNRNISKTTHQLFINIIDFVGRCL